MKKKMRMCQKIGICNFLFIRNIILFINIIMAAAIEPFSFLSIILKLLNLSDVKKDTIFSYTGEYIPETKTKTHIIPISLYPILSLQLS